MEEPNSLRIVLLGKHGSGKSSLANNILGEKIFSVSHRSDEKIRLSQTHTKSLRGREVTVIDTPGVVGAEDWDRAGPERHCEWLSCLLQVAPGPHALLLVMPVQRYTRQEQAVVEHIQTQFGEEMFRFTIVVFTHGDQLPENTDISEFVEENTELSKLVKACGGRCHVVDNKYWTKERQKGDRERSNEFQVEAILETVEKMVNDNQKYLSNDTLEQLEREIQTEQSCIHPDSSLSPEESRERAKNSLLDRYIDQATRRPPYVKYVVVVAGVAGVALAAIWVLRKVMKYLAEKPPLPLPLPVVPVEPPALPDLPPAPEVIHEVVQDVVQEVAKDVVQEVVQKVVPPVISELPETILTPPEVFCEKYDPFNPFQ